MYPILHNNSKTTFDVTEVSLSDVFQCVTTLSQALAHTTIKPKVMERVGIDVLFEPFLRRVLLNSYHKQLQLLRTKSRIHVEKGRILMGVLDEVGVLQPNEVYICYSSPQEEYVNLLFY